MSKQEYYEKAEQMVLEHARMMADQRPYSQRLEPVLTNEERKMHRSKLDETRQLKGSFRNYCTDIDVSSPCETLEDYDRNLMPFKWQTVNRGINTDSFREYCRAIDSDQEYIEKQEKI
jgi:hypothetical protein